MSHQSVLSDTSNPSESGSQGHISRWAISLDAVLQDELGIAAISSFLRKEYSEENIQFWLECSRLELETDQEIVSARVQDIISRFIGPDAESPVNIPDHLSQKALAEAHDPKPTSFVPQKEAIYNLMKFDSYSRFLRNELYAKLIELELEGHQITTEDIRRIENGQSPVRKKDKRKSTLQKLIGRKTELFAVEPRRNDKARSSIMRRKTKDKEMGSSSTLSSAHSSTSSIELEADDAKFNGTVCHIHFSDGGSTTIALKTGVPARSLLNNVASRRGLSPGCIDWLLLNEGSNTDSLSLDADSMCLSGRHIRGELRVTFRLDIVHIKRSIGIRSKIHKPVSEVLQPIMARYIPERTLSQVVVRLAGTKLPVNMMDPVSTLKEQRVVLELKENEFRKPVEPKRPKSDVQQSALDLLRRRRDSLGIRKRSRSRESGLNRISAVNIGIEEQDPNKAKVDFDNRLSLGGQGQLQDQRGLLNKNDLILPDFLRPAETADKENNKDNFDLDARIPTHEEADELFGGSIGDGPGGSHGLDGAFGGSSISLAFTETSSCSSSILRDSTNDLPFPVERKRLQKLSTSEDSNGNEQPSNSNSSEIVRKRTSLTQADLIDLPSPPKAKRSSTPQTTVV